MCEFTEFSELSPKNHLNDNKAERKPIKKSEIDA